ncbi:MAG: RsbRD N-terminal domain-containing protein, partial [Bryobacteraceae bacterium]
MPTANSRLSEVLEKREQEITDQWMEQQQAIGRKLTAAERDQANRQSREFVRSLKSALQRNSSGDISGPDWVAVREFLVDLSSGRAKDGYTPRETAAFVFSLKQPLFSA